MSSEKFEVKILNKICAITIILAIVSWCSIIIFDLNLILALILFLPTLGLVKIANLAAESIIKITKIRISR